MERICSKCGNPIDEGDSFCDACGEEYREAVAEKSGKKKPAANKTAPKKQTDAKHASGKLPGNKKQLIVTAVAVVILIAAVIAICSMAANTPEGALRKAADCRLSGNVSGLVAVDYDSNFSKAESKSDALARMKSDLGMTKKQDDGIKLRIKSESHVKDDEKTGSTALTDRINALSSAYNRTEEITDIRDLTYELVDNGSVKTSGTAEAIKVGGKWYIKGVAQTALTF